MRTVCSKASCFEAGWMSRLAVDLFVEDIAHEMFLRALATRLAREERVTPEFRVRTSIGGHGRVLQELELYQRNLERGSGGLQLPDAALVATDANCQGHVAAKRSVSTALRPALMDRTVVVCPDPHIERWYMADPDSFGEIVGSRPRLGRRKCQRDVYKTILADAVRRAGHPAMLDGIDFAADLVEGMDLHRAGRNQSSLKHAIGDIRSCFRLLRQLGGTSPD